jgi:hypothetical protein
MRGNANVEATQSISAERVGPTLKYDDTGSERGDDRLHHRPEEVHIAFVVDSIREGQIEAEVLAQPVSEFVNRACAGEELAIILVE